MSEALAGLAATGGASLPLFGVRPAGLEALLARLPGAEAQAGLSGFTAEAGQVLRLPEAALLGLGDGPALYGFGAAAAALPEGSVWHLTGDDFSYDDAALGFLLGAYRYDRFKPR
ncbi:MAG TPA: leucyl aminopeptidase family protein, partial [Acidocella sp.]|nr:leucyl aminopeptidase family protein [Acidocella sp.]